MGREEMQKAVLGYFRAVGAADREALRALFADDLVWRVPKGAIAPFAGEHRGADAIIEKMLSAVGDAFEAGSQETEVRNFLFGTDLVALEARMTASTPEGERYENDYVFFFEFRDGRIREIREYVDTRYAAEFFGRVAS